MRIAYVTIHIAPELMQGGVGKKIKDQMNAWRGQSHEVTLFSLTPAEIPFPGECQFLFEADVSLFKREVNRFFSLKRMLFFIRKYNPDVIYLRYGLYSYPLHRISRIAPVILETNSNDKVEYAFRGSFFYWMNRITRNFIFASASGIVSPTYELVGIFPFNKPITVISNGVDLSDVELLPPTHNTRPVITLVGSPGMSWHGVDKLIRLAEKCPDLTVNIVGYSVSDIEIPVPVNVNLHGYLNKHQIREVYLTTDVACGGLAAHRKNMDEGSALKIREALSYGIPLILANHDTDLNNLNLDVILRIPNTEDNVIENVGRIRKFAYDMIGRRVDINVIAPYIDQRQKEAARLDFFQKILDGHK
jgi:hypothetical protein